MINIDISHNFDAIEDFFNNFQQSVATNAVRAAMNKTLRTARSNSLKIVHKNLALNSKVKKRTAFKREMTFVNKAKGSNPYNMQASLVFSGIPMPLLWFVTGAPDITKQKGIKVKKRKKVKAQVFKGKKFIVKKAFIQKVNSKQIFKRTSKGKFAKQGVPSLAHFIKHRKMIKQIKKMMLEEFSKQLKNQMSYRMDKEIQKTNRKKMRKLP